MCSQQEMYHACLGLGLRDGGVDGAAEEDEEPKEDEELELSPEKGNVAFASAADGWAFRTGQFAALYAAKLGMKGAALERALWGDYRLDAKARRIARIRASQQGKHKPLFVQVAHPPVVCCRARLSSPSVLDMLKQLLSMQLLLLFVQLRACLAVHEGQARPYLLWRVGATHPADSPSKMLLSGSLAVRCMRCILDSASS